MNTRTFPVLLRREFWEHRGGFFWAPLVAAGIFFVVTLMGLVMGEVAAQKAVETGKLRIGGQVMVNGLDLSRLGKQMSSKDMQELAGGIDISLLLASAWPLIVLGFVVFFYCLGALYDDRKDRSVLFWKSLPVSDAETVWSKVASAIGTAPVLAFAVGIATMIVFLLALSIVTLVHGGNPVTLLWGPASPLKVIGLMIATLPVHAVWALPTVGWLLLCSAWARSKPFLWAVMIPVFSGILVSWLDLMNQFDLRALWFWKNVVARALFSVFPGTWVETLQIEPMGKEGMEAMQQVFNLKTLYTPFLSPSMWIGAVIGIVMILVAIRLRRWRDEN